MEKRIIAFDIGDKRIGVAASDPFNTFALPGTTYFRTKSAEADAENLAKLVREKDAGLIVCGMPVNFDGSESVQTEKTRRFVEILRTKTDVPIVFEDERFTTMEAERVLIAGGVRRENRKQSIDSIAASYILEGYLNKKKKGAST
ncbi:MAG TPA: Holliday junction resolvase RuvX [Candidatus Borkfalkia excrementigallinarum]|uniref:Putative pre-16S rRNA nuclease n=1 Tax=Candidatus Borkfalkia excrementigallinarum TaxID=2838506 RepID=A0A9D2CSF5_9FIRM|nr:Holliday junction resolvase RuvX [Candidatus Borkfalkia excrementigallinarum]